jgi:hypothetical protein
VVTHTKSPWPRRALTFPLVTLAASLGTALAPVLLVPALFHDLARFALSRRPFVLVRLVAFALLYAWAEVVGLAMLGLVWLASLPSRERHATLVARTYVVQRHWAHALLVFARRLLALCFEVAGEAHVSPGPVIVLVNHASLLDTLLPTIFVTHTHGLALRFVLKEELLVSPCLDVAGLRLPNVFVDRSSAQTARELERIRALSSGLGRRRDPLPRAHAHDAQEARASAREARDGRPSLHAEALKLTHVLPPRFGGTSAPRRCPGGRRAPAGAPRPRGHRALRRLPRGLARGHDDPPLLAHPTRRDPGRSRGPGTVAPPRVAARRCVRRLARRRRPLTCCSAPLGAAVESAAHRGWSR